MSLPILNMLFPVVVAIHNAEEWLQRDWLTPVRQRKFARRFSQPQVIRNAMILLTLLATAIGLGSCVHQDPLWRQVIAIGAFALTWNSLGHILASIKARWLVPGTVSASVLVLPYGSTLIAMLHCAGMPWLSILRLAGLGLVMLPFLVAASLSLGYLLVRWTTAMPRRLPPSAP